MRGIGACLAAPGLFPPLSPLSLPGSAMARLRVENPSLLADEDAPQETPAPPRLLRPLLRVAPRAPVILSFSQIDRSIEQLPVG